MPERNHPPLLARPLTEAILAVAASSDLALDKLISADHLGTNTLDSVRELLAYHASGSSSSAHRVWQVLWQCSIFEEDHSRKYVALPPERLGLLPSPVWERHMAALSKLLPLHPVKYHTASATQRQLLKHAQLQVLQLKEFLSSSLLPAINSSKSSQTEPLLLQALDELSAVTGPAGTVEELDRIFVDSFLVPIDSCVDSTSELCRNLFGKQDSLWDSGTFCCFLVHTLPRSALLC